MKILTQFLDANNESNKVFLGVTCNESTWRDELIPKLEEIDFETIGNECLNKINGKYIQKKYGLKPGIQLGNKLHEERIIYIKNLSRRDAPNDHFEGGK